jgi:hypothetical protein
MKIYTSESREAETWKIQYYLSPDEIHNTTDVYCLMSSIQNAKIS